MMVQTMLVKRTLLLLTAMLAALVLASGVAMAVNKACPSGTTEQNPCLGTNKTKRTSGNDTLIGTSGVDYIKALSGNDQISGGAGSDTADGGAGNDTYSYKDGWGTDTLIDSGGIDHLNFSAVGSDKVFANFIPEFGAATQAALANGAAQVTFSGSAIEKVTGGEREGRDTNR